MVANSPLAPSMPPIVDEREIIAGYVEAMGRRHVYQVPPPETPSFVFAGLRPYVELLIAQLGLPDDEPELLRAIHRGETSWHAGQAQGVLSQLSSLVDRAKKGLVDRESASESIQHLDRVITSLEVIIDAILVAKAEAVQALGLEPTIPVLSITSEGELTDAQPIHQSLGGGTGVQHDVDASKSRKPQNDSRQSDRHQQRSR